MRKRDRKIGGGVQQDDEKQASLLCLCTAVSGTDSVMTEITKTGMSASGFRAI
jgi:hypothetical protein